MLLRLSSVSVSRVLTLVSKSELVSRLTSPIAISPSSIKPSAATSESTAASSAPSTISNRIEPAVASSSVIIELVDSIILPTISVPLEDIFAWDPLREASIYALLKVIENFFLNFVLAQRRQPLLDELILLILILLNLRGLRILLWLSLSLVLIDKILGLCKELTTVREQLGLEQLFIPPLVLRLERLVEGEPVWRKVLMTVLAKVYQVSRLDTG